MFMLLWNARGCLTTLNQLDGFRVMNFFISLIMLLHISRIYIPNVYAQPTQNTILGKIYLLVCVTLFNIIHIYQNTHMATFC
jgi:hypothetical protein